MLVPSLPHLIHPANPHTCHRGSQSSHVPTNTSKILTFHPPFWASFRPSFWRSVVLYRPHIEAQHIEYPLNRKSAHALVYITVDRVSLPCVRGKYYESYVQITDCRGSEGEGRRCYFQHMFRWRGHGLQRIKWVSIATPQRRAQFKARIYHMSQSRKERQVLYRFL